MIAQLECVDLVLQSLFFRTVPDDQQLGIPFDLRESLNEFVEGFDGYQVANRDENERNSVRSSFWEMEDTTVHHVWDDDTVAAEILKNVAAQGF